MGMNVAKCAIKLGDRTIIERVIENVSNSGVEGIICVLGYKGEEVEPLIRDKVKIYYQENQLGTADAVKACKKEFESEDCDILIVAGDMPFVKSETFKSAYYKYLKEEADLLVCTCEKEHPFGYGRIIRNNGKIAAIREERDCSAKEKEIKEVNSSIYIVNNKKLFNNIEKIKNNNAQKEYYLTDIVSLFKEEGLKITGFNFKNEVELSGINNPDDLKNALEKI